MKTMQRFGVLALLLVAFLTLGTLGVAQSPTGGNGATNPAGDDNDPKGTADEQLVTFILDDFEKAASWIPEMPRDQGVIFSMQRPGTPQAVSNMLKQITDQNQNYLKGLADQGKQNSENPLVGFPYNQNKFVLGVRVEFMKRGYNWFTVRPPLPIKVPGVCKSLSVYVAGRGYNHSLWVMIRDYEGNKRFLSAMRPLNHKGWRRVLFPIKPNIVQEDYKVTDPKKIGITFDGFLINCDPMESQGKYYIYFDFLTAQVDLYFDSNGDKDDMRDFW